jgi:hypothetical protein
LPAAAALAVDFLDAGQEGGFVFGQAAQRVDADRFGHAQQDQAAHGGAAAGAAEIGEEGLVAQDRIDASAMAPRSRPPRRGWSLK